MYLKNSSQLIKLLLVDNSIESSQKATGKNINDQQLPYGTIDIPKMPSENFFKEGNIFINKHHRYSKMPAHTHEFVEFNYMLSGSCVQYINNQKIFLSEGEILLLDKDTVQKIDALGEKDILINILLKEESITTEVVINMVKSNSLVNEFLLNASKSNNNHNKFIHFHCANNDEVQQYMNKMMIEYYNKEKYYMRKINLILSLLLIELTRELEKENREQSDMKNELVVTILRYIDTNYKDLTLDNLANNFGYNSNYLSNKLKKETGYSFKELINLVRFKEAKERIEDSNDSFEAISYQIGFESVPSLYKLFSKFSSLTPNEMREKSQQKN